MPGASVSIRQSIAKLWRVNIRLCSRQKNENFIKWSCPKKSFALNSLTIPRILFLLSSSATQPWRWRWQKITKKSGGKSNESCARSNDREPPPVSWGYSQAAKRCHCWDRSLTKKNRVSCKSQNSFILNDDDVELTNMTDAPRNAEEATVGVNDVWKFYEGKSIIAEL